MSEISAGAQLYLENDVFIWKFDPGVKINLRMAQEGYRITKQQLKGKKVPVIVFMEASGIDAKSRKFYKEESIKYFSAGAIVIKSPIGRVLGNFFVGLNKPPMPMKLVKSVEEAQEFFNSCNR